MTAEYNPGREPCPVECQGDFRVVEFWREKERFYAILDNRCEEMLCDALLRENVTDPDYTPWIWPTLEEAEQICSGLNSGEWWLCELCFRPIPIPQWLLDLMTGATDLPSGMDHIPTPDGLICDDCALDLERRRVETSRLAWDKPITGARIRRDRPTKSPQQPGQIGLFAEVS